MLLVHKGGEVYYQVRQGGRRPLQTIPGANKKGKSNSMVELSIPATSATASAGTVSSAQPSQGSNQTPSSTPTIQSPFELQGLSSLGIGTATYQEELQNFSNRASRANSIKRSSNGMTINSRTTSGPSSVGNPDSAFSYSGGQVTPDSLTTSGAATPYSLQHDGHRLPFSPEGNYHANNSNPALDLNNISRPHSGPAYPSSGGHPHIMGSANGSRNDLDLSHLFTGGNHEDFNNGHYPNQNEESHQANNMKSEYPGAPFSMGSYSGYHSR
ncbi:MAG: hypothetical protein Q9183_002986 [Haloplaca sp. 2 TL-2023]